MCNDAYIPDDEQQMMQAQIEQEQQEFELHMQQIEMQNEIEHQQYLDVLTNDFYGSSVTLMTEFN
jgi:hypothetical protein